MSHSTPVQAAHKRPANHLDLVCYRRLKAQDFARPNTTPQRIALFGFILAFALLLVMLFLGA